ncbi:MAG: oligosaccharide flippase family protein, partial [Myxococcota bacterium]
MTVAQARSAAPPSEAAVKVGRGALLITAAKVVFLITGAVVNFSLASLLTPKEYGDYGVTIRWVSLLNMMVVQGLLQGMSRAVAQAPQSAGVVRTQALPVVTTISLVTGGLVLLLASPLAGALGDEGLTPLLRTAALITTSYAFYAALVGIINGLQRFKAQALLDMGFSTTKMVFILAGAALGLGAQGSVAGFGVAAVVMAVLTASVATGLGKEPLATRLTFGSFLSFSGWVMGYQALLNLLMFLDLALVRRAAGLGALPTEAAGLYAGAVN